MQCRVQPVLSVREAAHTLTTLPSPSLTHTSPLPCPAPPSLAPSLHPLHYPRRVPQRSTRLTHTHTHRSKQLSLLGPLRPQPTKVWKRKFVKVMVVGDSGLGKTTLISALLSKPGEQLQVHDGTNTPLGQFLKDPDSLITRVTWKDEQDKVCNV